MIRASKLFHLNGQRRFHAQLLNRVYCMFKTYMIGAIMTNDRCCSPRRSPLPDSFPQS